GYIGIPNASLIRDTVAALRGRETETRFRWVKGHSGHQGNERADRLANEGASCQSEGNINPYLEITGARLQEITQKLAYKAIRIRKM
ncbi:hypothetical protein EDD85DRAFT_767808, partial [Armillaria nabsnona]